MAYSPYQIAGTQASLYDLLQESQLKKFKGQQETSKQKGKMREEFEEELARAQAKARKDAKPGFLSQALSLAGMGLGPLGAALTSGISAGIQGDKQRQAMKKLLSGVDSKRWGKTFLRDPMKSYKEEAQSMQMSSGDVLRGAFGSGLTGFATSKMLGGDKETGGLFKKMGEAKKGIVLEGGERVSSEAARKKIGLKAGERIKDIKFSDTGIEDIFGKGAKLPGGVSEAAIFSKNPALQQLMESFKGMGTGGKGVTDELQSAMMLPMLLQMMMGE